MYTVQTYERGPDQGSGFAVIFRGSLTHASTLYLGVHTLTPSSLYSGVRTLTPSLGEVVEPIPRHCRRVAMPDGVVPINLQLEPPRKHAPVP